MGCGGACDKPPANACRTHCLLMRGCREHEACCRSTRLSLFSLHQAAYRHFTERLLTYSTLTCSSLALVQGGNTGFPVSSIVGWLCQRPWLVSAGGLVGSSSCHLVRAAAQVPLAALREGVRNVRLLATTLSEPTAVALVGLWPRCDAPVLPPHDAP